MMTGYSPLHFMEALAAERRTKRRIAAGRGAAAFTITARQRLARTLIQLGYRLRGEQGEAIPRTTNA